MQPKTLAEREACPPFVYLRSVPLLECIPNLSEGRRTAPLHELVAAAERPGMVRADLSSDPDHNRSVLTWLGEPEVLVEAVLALSRAMVETFDLRLHRGNHPRVGLVDVVPFVPLAPDDMPAAVTAARSCGARLADELAIPVFLYERAATREEHRDLAALRRGGLAGLTRRMGEGLRPDFGPLRPHPRAGVVLVGARTFLIAFNVVLESDDLELARAIAATVREAAPGGSPGIKAIGVELGSAGRVQVSLNVVDFRRTGLLAILDRVRAEASRRGVAVRGTELVGLAPLQAILDVARDALTLPDLAPRQLIETHGAARAPSEPDPDGSD